MVLLKVSCQHIPHSMHASTRACQAVMVTPSVLVVPSRLAFYLQMGWARHHQAVGSMRLPGLQVALTAVLVCWEQEWFL